jgi:multiple sugar transport system ATP-binding protein
VFVGPSGCGKSTLLRLIAGLERSASGSIRIGERDVTGVDPAKRGIAMVFQTYALYPHMSVAENMGFGLEMAGMAKPEREKLVRQAAEMLHLTDYLDRKPRQLSGGQRQRVAIGRAIVRNPDIFLFDEPLSNLDAELRVRMRLEIAKLHKDLGATMVYVTHDQVEAMTLADRIVVLRAGLVEQIGSPMQLYSDPDNRFVAGFIGSPRMNFIDAGRLGASDAKTIGVRPEHVTLSRDSGEWQARAVHVEHLGADTIVYLESEKVGAFTVRLFGEHHYAPGDVVFATPAANQMHRFDANGHAIR